MIEIIPHVRQAPLGDIHEPAVRIAGEAMPHFLIFAETVVRFHKNFFQHILLAQPVIIIHKVIQQIVDLVPGLHADHVSAGHTAQPAPVTRALVHHKHVSDLFCRCFCGPGPAYASAYDQHIR